MYTRIPSGRYPRGMRVPENYGGNAFRSLPNESANEEGVPKPPVTESIEQAPIRRDSPPPSPDTTPPEAASAPHAPAGRFSLGLPFLRRDGIGIGLEELLLVGLIFLVAQEGKNDDLVWLLLLLLLIQ